MAAIETSRTTFATATVANRLGTILTALMGALVAWNDARVTRKVLNELSDRELEDIGLVRGDIDRVADEGF